MRFNCCSASCSSSKNFPPKHRSTWSSLSKANLLSSPISGWGPLVGEGGGQRWMSRHLRSPLQSTDQPGRRCRAFGDIVLKCCLVWVFCREDTITPGLPTSNRHRTIRKHCFSRLRLREAPEELQIHHLAVITRPAHPWTCVTSVPSPQNSWSKCHHVATHQSLN